MSETVTNYHECKALSNIDNISIQKTKGNGTGFTGKKKGIQ